jgi:hypothetical protein
MSRTSQILNDWHAVARAAALPKDPPKPGRSVGSVGLAGVALAVIFLGVVTLRGPNPAPPGTAGGVAPAPSVPTTVLTSPNPAQGAASFALPGAGGTCSASQFVLGKATSGYGYGPIGTSVVFVSQPLRNAGDSCILELPKTIGVASVTGSAVAVEAADSGSLSLHIGRGQSISLLLMARWPAGGSVENRTPSPCEGPVSDVTTVIVPFASGTIKLDLSPTWDQVCRSPASVSLTIVS